MFFISDQTAAMHGVEQSRLSGPASHKYITEPLQTIGSNVNAVTRLNIDQNVINEVLTPQNLAQMSNFEFVFTKLGQVLYDGDLIVVAALGNTLQAVRG